MRQIYNHVPPPPLYPPGWEMLLFLHRHMHVIWCHPPQTVKMWCSFTNGSRGCGIVLISGYCISSWRLDIPHKTKEPLAWQSCVAQPAKCTLFGRKGSLCLKEHPGMICLLAITKIVPVCNRLSLHRCVQCRLYQIIHLVEYRIHGETVWKLVVHRGKNYWMFT